MSSPNFNRMANLIGRIMFNKAMVRREQGARKFRIAVGYRDQGVAVHLTFRTRDLPDTNTVIMFAELFTNQRQAKLAAEGIVASVPGATMGAGKGAE